jgi:hypothetical protein
MVHDASVRKHVCVMSIVEAGGHNHISQSKNSIETGPSTLFVIAGAFGISIFS